MLVSHPYLPACLPACPAVPFLLRGPGIGSGQLVAQYQGSMVDLAPTILSLAGLPIPASLDGTPLPTSMYQVPDRDMWVGGGGGGAHSLYQTLRAQAFQA